MGAREEIMDEPCNRTANPFPTSAASSQKGSSGGGGSRRAFLKASGVPAMGTAQALVPAAAIGQSAAVADPDLARLQGTRRILLKGGVVLTLDRQIGDFAQADVLIEDGKIREVRPAISASPESAAVIDAANRIVMPGFIDSH